MTLIAQTVFILAVVHLTSVLCFHFLLKASFVERMRSLDSHPANQGKTALQIGGVVIVPVTVIFGMLSVNHLTGIGYSQQMPIVTTIAILYLVGVIDDTYNQSWAIPASFRLALHFGVSVLMTYLVYQATRYSGLENRFFYPGVLLTSIFMVLALSWVINTTNFIDGMDLFLFSNVLPGALLFSGYHIITGKDPAITITFAIFVSALLGFFWFNCPKARVYMGDGGTLCIGFLIGSCAIYILAKHGSVAGFIPFTYMLVDTTFTLISRLKRRENPFKSHSDHAFQVAKRNHQSDASILAKCFGLSSINTLLAYLCFQFDHFTGWQIAFALLAFILSVIVFFSYKLKSVN